MYAHSRALVRSNVSCSGVRRNKRSPADRSTGSGEASNAHRPPLVTPMGGVVVLARRGVWTCRLWQARRGTETVRNPGPAPVTCGSGLRYFRRRRRAAASRAMHSTPARPADRVTSTSRCGPSLRPSESDRSNQRRCFKRTASSCGLGRAKSTFGALMVAMISGLLLPGPSALSSYTVVAEFP